MPIHPESQVEPIPGYRLIQRLGGGGFGEVWKCEAPGGLFKAIKFVFGDLNSVAGDDDTRAVQELKSLERIKNVRHPYILSLERYEVIDGQLLIVTELADKNLWERFKECRGEGNTGIGREELLRYIEEAAEALDMMNKVHDLLHLDIKPQNLFLVYNHVKVADFGLVKDLEGMMANVTGGITPVYAAPETFEGYVTRFSDQYSLAIVYQELLTGIRPYTGTNARQLMMQHLHGQPRLDVLPELERSIVARALNKDPQTRWPTCTEFVKALRNAGVTRPTFTSPKNESNIQNLDRSRATTGLARYESSSDDQIAPTITEQNTALRLPEKQLPPVKLDNVAGILRPTLIIGLGQFGRVVSNMVREEIQGKYGDHGIPSLRFSNIDTDSEPISDTFHPPQNEDVYLARLNRPAHYIGNRTQVPPVDSWINSQILYRIPRGLTTAGIRALGRLAYIDHYASIRGRFIRDMEAVMDDRSMSEAALLTGLAVQSLHPRVYIVAHLGGGTGSGMFLDAAFTIRDILRERNKSEFEIAGIFFTPPPTQLEELELEHANTYAALTELNHFQSGRNTFMAIYDIKEAAKHDDQAPFQFNWIFPIPGRTVDKVETSPEMVRSASQILVRSILTPLGYATDKLRSQDATRGINLPAMRVLASPRRLMIRSATGKLASKLIANWIQPPTSDVVRFVDSKLETILGMNELHPEKLIARFESALSNLWQKPPSEYAREICGKFFTPPGEARYDRHKLKKAIDNIHKQLGREMEAGRTALGEETETIRILDELLVEIVRNKAEDFKDNIFRSFDRPGVRAGGAEEFIRQTVEKFDTWSKEAETQGRQSAIRHAEALKAFKVELDELEKFRAPSFRRKVWTHPLPGERLMEIFQSRYNQLLYEKLTQVFIGLRGVCSDQAREVKFGTQRLSDLQKSFSLDDPLLDLPKPTEKVSRTLMIPQGSTNIAEAIDTLINSVTKREYQTLDMELGKILRSMGIRLGYSSTKSKGDVIRVARDIILRKVTGFLENRLTMDDAAGMFLEQPESLRDIALSLTSIFEQAQPTSLRKPERFQETALMLVPATPNGEHLLNAGRIILKSAQGIQIYNSDEIVIFREISGIPVSELPIMSEMVELAYKKAVSIDNFTPHSRQDVEPWMPLKK